MIKLMSKNMLLEIMEETDREYAPGILRPQNTLGIKDRLKLLAVSEDCSQETKSIPIGSEVMLEMGKDDVRHYALEIDGKNCLIAKESYAIGWV